MESYQTEQENFWAGSFGDQYIDRNKDQTLFAQKISLFSKVLQKAQKISSLIEFGANIGLNIQALKVLLPEANCSAIEINQSAVEQLQKIHQLEVFHQSILDFQHQKKWDFVFTKAVLIHMPPESLDQIYESLYHASEKYIAMVEYFNPTPVEITYRGHSQKLFKRDFAGEMLDKFSDLKLVDYGFCYEKDPNFSLDNFNWFLLEKS